MQSEVECWMSLLFSLVKWDSEREREEIYTKIKLNNNIKNVVLKMGLLKNITKQIKYLHYIK